MKRDSFDKVWKSYEPLLRALSELLHPFAEIAVHDLKRGVLVAIYHNISKREIGDPSPLSQLKVDTEDFPDFFPPYFKENWDGRPLKCTSITLRDSAGRAVGLICINIDASYFQEGYQLFKAFLSIKEEAKHPVEMFGRECEAQVTALMDAYFKDKQLSQRHLKREEKRELVYFLYRKGVFNFKNAIPLVAQKLNTSRATIYNYIGSIDE